MSQPPYDPQEAQLDILDAIQRQLARIAVALEALVEQHGYRISFQEGHGTYGAEEEKADR